MLNNNVEETRQQRANLLRMYKQEMSDNVDRKTQEKQQRILEERKALDRMNQQFEEEKTKKQNQKTFLINQRLEEYQSYQNHKNSNKKGKFVQQGQENMNGVNGNDYQEEVNNNSKNLPQMNHLPQLNLPIDDNNHMHVPNSGSFRQNENYNTYNNVDPYQQSQQYDNNTNINSNINNFNNNPNINNNFTPSNQSTNNNVSLNNNNYAPNMSDYHLSERTKKFEQQQAYKNYLDSQVSTRSNRSQSSTRPYENKNLLPKKNNELKANPFSNKNYEFGSSALDHNPILNPTNNYGYNRYITNSNQGKFQRAANNIIG